MQKVTTGTQYLLVRDVTQPSIVQHPVRSNSKAGALLLELFGLQRLSSSLSSSSCSLYPPQQQVCEDFYTELDLPLFFRGPGRVQQTFALGFLFHFLILKQNEGSR